MDKKKAVDKIKKAVSLFFRIRRGFKAYIAFATGVLSGIAVYGDIYEITENTPYSIAVSCLLGAFITSIMLLMLKLIWISIDKIKTIGIRILEKYKERRSENDKPAEKE